MGGSDCQVMSSWLANNTQQLCMVVIIFLNRDHKSTVQYDHLLKSTMLPPRSTHATYLPGCSVVAAALAAAVVAHVLPRPP